MRARHGLPAVESVSASNNCGWHFTCPIQVAYICCGIAQIGPYIWLSFTETVWVLRRISAVSVAQRVASERGEAVGQTVGYQIRMEAARSAATRLLFVREALGCMACWAS